MKRLDRPDGSGPLVSGEPRESRGTPTRLKKKKSINKLRLAAIFAAVAGVAGAAYIASHTHSNGRNSPFVEEKQPAFLDHASSLAIVVGGKEMAKIYDDKLIIKFDARTKKVTRAPLYNDMEQLAHDLNRDADFQSYFVSMQDTWIGRPPGAGGVYTEKYNPGGTLTQYGGTNDYARISPAMELDDKTNGFLDVMQNAPGYSTAIGAHPDVQSFIQTRPQRLQWYAQMRGKAMPDIAKTRNDVQKDTASAPLLSLMASDANTPSQAFLTLRSVVQAFNLRNPGVRFDVDALSDSLMRTNSNPTAMCRVATMWRAADKDLRSYKDFAAAVADVQKSEDAKGSGINVMDSLNKSRDIATKGAATIQRTYSLHCNG